ncbi:MAG: hypothetical protein IKS37_05430 [Solobacterium sp.]|nr:hypothetical protein [Solobacterium sp.]
MRVQVHEKTEYSFSFERLKMLYERYPQYHVKHPFTTLDALLDEHPRYQETIAQVQDEYMENGYEQFLVRLGLDDLPYRYETMKKIEAHGPFEMNPYVRDFLQQFEDLNTDTDACFIFPESFSSQFFVAAEVCKRAREFHPIQNLFPDEDQLHYLAVFDKENMDDVLLMYHLLYTGSTSDFYGGYSLYDYSLPWYQNHLQQDGTVLRSPYLPDRTAVFQGALPFYHDPAKTVYVRRNIAHILECGYVSSELEFFEHLVRYILPLLQWWYTDLSLYEEKDGYKTDWRLQRTRIRTELTEKGIIKPKWKHELSLFQAIRKRYPDTLYQYRPDWLERQSLDLYIPSLQAGIEYQGIQHYHQVGFFGGEEALLHRWELDMQKKKRCEENGVRYIEWPYDLEPTAANVRKMLEVQKEKQDERLEAFLRLADFDEYMEKFPSFCGMKTGAFTFRKEQDLMESDAQYSRREKENIRERRKREIVKDLHRQIEVLMEEIEIDGIWIRPLKWRKKIEFRYNYPNERRGDLDHYLAGLYHEPESLGRDEYRVVLSAKDVPVIELLMMESPLYLHYEAMQKEPAVSFLLQVNRIAKIEYCMYQINYYHEEYRSLRSIPDPKLKKLLQGYHKDLRDKTNSIYEELIEDGQTNPRWKSEQKTYAIVRRYFPDARFQYQMDFLFNQRLDIYIPSMHTAIEYQGKQHYEPVAFFGGKEGNRRNKERDERKKRRCNAHGIQVIYWKYDSPVSEEYFLKYIMPRIKEQ